MLDILPCFVNIIPNSVGYLVSSLMESFHEHKLSLAYQLLSLQLSLFVSCLREFYPPWGDEDLLSFLLETLLFGSSHFGPKSIWN